MTATPVVTLNSERDPSRLIPDAYLRRAVVLDTSSLRDATTDLDETARRLARSALPTMDSDLAPPAPELPDPARFRLRAILRACLTPRGWELIDVEAITRLALGRWAAPETDVDAAVMSVAADYLLVTATRAGLVEPDWPVRLEGLSGGTVEPIAATLATTRARQASGTEREATVARATLDASLALAGERERLRDAVDHSVRSVPRGRTLSADERATIATVRGKARPLREAIAAARGLDALGELDERLDREVLAPLGAVADAVESRRRAAEQAHQREAEVRRRTAERQRGERKAARQARQARRQRHATLRVLYRRGTTRPGEDVLDALVEAGCLVRRTETYESETLGSRIVHSAPGRTLRSMRDAMSPTSVVPPDPRGAWLPAAGPAEHGCGAGAPLRDAGPGLVRGPGRPPLLAGRAVRLGERAGPRNHRRGG